METTLAPNHAPPTVTPVKKKFYKKWWFGAIVITVVIVLLIVIANLLILYNTCMFCNSTDSLAKLNDKLFTNHCESSGKIVEQTGYSKICYDKSEKAGQDCLQDSECNGGACRLTYEESKNLRMNSAGYILGTCSQAKYQDQPYTGENGDRPCGASLNEPLLASGEFNYDAYSLGGLLCD